MNLEAYPPYFARAVKDTILAEGGAMVTNHAWDPGGLTKYGISQKAYPSLDIKSLTEDEAINIYFHDYWVRSGCNRLESKYVASELFDSAVNTGPYRAGQFLQKAINFLDSSANLVVDGAVGPKTAAAANKLSQRYELPLVIAMNLMQGVFYIKVCMSNAELKEAAAKGLMKRLVPPPELLKG